MAGSSRKTWLAAMQRLGIDSADLSKQQAGTQLKLQLCRELPQQKGRHCASIRLCRRMLTADKREPSSSPAQGQQEDFAAVILLKFGQHCF